MSVNRVVNTRTRSRPSALHSETRTLQSGLDRRPKDAPRERRARAGEHLLHVACRHDVRDPVLLERCVELVRIAERSGARRNGTTLKEPDALSIAIERPLDIDRTAAEPGLRIDREPRDAYAAAHTACT